MCFVHLLLLFLTPLLSDLNSDIKIAEVQTLTAHKIINHGETTLKGASTKCKSSEVSSSGATRYYKM